MIRSESQPGRCRNQIGKYLDLEEWGVASNDFLKRVLYISPVLLNSLTQGLHVTDNNPTNPGRSWDGAQV